MILANCLDCLILLGLLLIFNALYIIGLHSASQGTYILAPLNKTWNKMLLGWESRSKIVNILKDALYEGSIGCIVCMPSIHSLIFLSITLPKLGFNLGQYLTLMPNLFTVIICWIFYVCILHSVVDFFDTIRKLIIVLIVKNG